MSGYAADTSVAVAALLGDHPAHEAALGALRSFRPALAGHALFETYSTLTRLPIEYRLDPKTAGDLVERNFPLRCNIKPGSEMALMREFAAAGVAGGAIYDALVGASTRVEKRLLLSLDRRAVRTYQAIGVTFELIA